MWFAVLAASILIFVVTGNPLLASLLPYLSAARHCTRAAFWLRTVDPFPQRGRACFWFYLATAAWRAASAAFVTVVGFAIVQIVRGIGPNMAVFSQTMIVLLCGLALATLLGLVGVVSALAARVRVFVIPDIHRQATGDFDLVLVAATLRPRFNHAIFVLASVLIVPVLLVGGTFAALGADGRGPNAPNSLMGSLGLGVVMLGPVVMLPVYLVLSQRVVAATPAICWPEQCAGLAPEPG